MVYIDSGLNASDGAAAPASGNMYFGVFVSTSDDSSSTSHTVAGGTAGGYLVNFYLTNSALEFTS